jgi:hypothetical protein
VIRGWVEPGHTEFSGTMEKSPEAPPGIFMLFLCFVIHNLFRIILPEINQNIMEQLVI